MRTIKPLRRMLSSLMLLALLTGAAAAQTRAGSITEISGTGRIQRNGGSIVAVLAVPIMERDKIETADRSSLTILLLDGSRLTLSESSSIVMDRTIMVPTVANPAVSVLIKLFAGQLRSLVHPMVGAPPHFEIHTPNAVVAVRGTDFETKYIAGKPCPGFPKCLRYTDVGVFQGIVEVSNPTGSKPASVRVASGYETTVPCELPPATPGPLGMGDLTAPGYH